VSKKLGGIRVRIVFTFNDTLKAARPNVTLLSSVKNTDIGVKYHHAVKGDKATAQDTSNEKEDAKEVRSNRTNGKEVEEKEDEDATKEKTRTKKEEDKNDQELDKGLRVDGEEVGKEVLIGGDTDGNRSARGSIRERHQVKTFSEAKEKSPLGGEEDRAPGEENGDGLAANGKPLLRPTFSLKAVVDVEEMGRCLSRVTTSTSSSSTTSSKMQGVADLGSLATIIEDPVFRLLVSVHNTIQRVQCFQCPPPALCSDARDLVQECMVALQPSHLSHNSKSFLHQL